MSNDTIRKALKLAPEIIEHVVSLIDFKGSTGGERVTGTKDAPVPFNLQAFNDANEVYQRLVYWSVFVAGKIGIQPPGPAVRAWRAVNGTVVGLPYNIEPAGARYVAGVMSRWLDLHLGEAESCTELDDLAYFADEMKDVFRVNARWPQLPKAKYSKMPCPDDRGLIALFPPERFGEDELRQCELCARVFPETEYLVAFKAFMDGEKTRRHLARKYA